MFKGGDNEPFAGAAAGGDCGGGDFVGIEDAGGFFVSVSSFSESLSSLSIIITSISLVLFISFWSSASFFTALLSLLSQSTSISCPLQLFSVFVLSSSSPIFSWTTFISLPMCSSSLLPFFFFLDSLRFLYILRRLGVFGS